MGPVLLFFVWLGKAPFRFGQRNSLRNLNRTLMADPNITALLAALDVFGRAPDKEQLERANAWLQDFQHSVIVLSPGQYATDLTVIPSTAVA